MKKVGYDTVRKARIKIASVRIGKDKCEKKDEIEGWGETNFLFFG